MAYSGGKGNCFQQIINLMPKHQCYVEPFAGHAKVYEHKKAAEVNFALDLDWSVIAHLKEHFAPRLEVRRMCGIQLLEQREFSESTLIYCDPPYLNAGVRYYRHSLSEPDHKRLLRSLISQPKAMIMISGLDSSLYRDMLSNWHCHPIINVTRNGRVTEYIWTNYDPNLFEKHDSRYLGENYREREKYKRQVTSIKRKLESIDKAQLRELSSWLTSKLEEN